MNTKIAKKRSNMIFVRMDLLPKMALHVLDQVNK